MYGGRDLLLILSKNKYHNGVKSSNEADKVRGQVWIPDDIVVCRPQDPGGGASSSNLMASNQSVKVCRPSFFLGISDPIYTMPLPLTSLDPWYPLKCLLRGQEVKTHLPTDSPVKVTHRMLKAIQSYSFSVNLVKMACGLVSGTFLSLPSIDSVSSACS